MVDDAEKAALRELLSGGVGMEEPEARVASQVIYWKCLKQDVFHSIPFHSFFFFVWCCAVISKRND